MAVKFSQFDPATIASNVEFIVGYSTSGNKNQQIPPANLNTTYSFTTITDPGDAANVDLVLTGAQPNVTNTTESIQFTAGTAIALTAGTDEITITNNGVTSFTNSNGGSFVAYGTVNTDATGAVTIGDVDLTAGGTASTTTFLRGDNTWATPASGTDTTYTVDVPTGTTSINLKDSNNNDDAIVLVGGTDIGLVRDSANQITINSQAVGGVTSVDEKAAGVSSGTPIIVDPTTGAVEVQSMAYAGQGNVGHVPAGGVAGQYLDGAAGAWITLPSTLSIDKQTFTGNGTLTDFTLTTAAGCTADNLNIYISGVYQNSVDASNAVNYTVTSGLNPTLQFVSAGTPTAPPVTATRGIEVVITR